MNRLLCLTLLSLPLSAQTADTIAYRELHSSCTANGLGVYSLNGPTHCGCGRYSERDATEERLASFDGDKQTRKMAKKNGAWHCVPIDPSRPIIDHIGVGYVKGEYLITPTSVSVTVLR